MNRRPCGHLFASVGAFAMLWDAPLGEGL